MVELSVAVGNGLVKVVGGGGDVMTEFDVDEVWLLVGDDGSDDGRE